MGAAIRTRIVKSDRVLDGNKPLQRAMADQKDDVLLNEHKAIIDTLAQMFAE